MRFKVAEHLPKPDGFLLIRDIIGKVLKTLVNGIAQPNSPVRCGLRTRLYEQQDPALQFAHGGIEAGSGDELAAGPLGVLRSAKTLGQPERLEALRLFLENNNVLTGGYDRLRLVTHLDVSEDDAMDKVDAALV